MDHSHILGTELRFVFTTDRKWLSETARGIRRVWPGTRTAPNVREPSA